jgi:hypothetical protein
MSQGSRFEVKGGHVPPELLEAHSAAFDEAFVDLAVLGQQLGHPVQQLKVALGPNREVHGCRYGGLYAPGIDHHDRRIVPIHLDPLPHDRMRVIGVFIVGAELAMAWSR